MTLNLSQKRAYESEAEENFRWLYSLLATQSSRVLTPADLMDEQVHLQLSEIGQYAEIAHGSISPAFVFEHLEELCQPGRPLEDYDALKRDGARLVRHFRGDVADVQGYVAFRPAIRQLVVAFSGTSSPSQAFKDMQTWRIAYPRDAGQSTVHSGFWEMYQGVRPRTYEALRLGFQEHGSEIDSVVLTGHSMGCTMCYLLALDLMAEMEQGETAIPQGTVINLLLFGSPRLGNEGLAMYWRKCVKKYAEIFGESSFVEYSVKGYNDGVPTLPPYTLGFRHLTESPLYSYHGRLYRIPASENEHGAFTVKSFDNSSGNAVSSSNPGEEPSQVTIQLKPLEHVAWPRGGHNYYNDRDMEKLQRHMRWLNVTLHGEQGWQERYTQQLKKWEMKWGKDVEESVG